MEILQNVLNVRLLETFSSVLYRIHNVIYFGSSCSGHVSIRWGSF